MPEKAAPGSRHESVPETPPLPRGTPRVQSLSGLLVSPIVPDVQPSAVGCSKLVAWMTFSVPTSNAESCSGALGGHVATRPRLSITCTWYCTSEGKAWPGIAAVYADPPTLLMNASWYGPPFTRQRTVVCVSGGSKF